MRVLIIGDADSMFIKAIIKKTFLPYGDNISILSRRNKIYRDFYNEQGITVYQNKIDIVEGKKLKTLWSMINDLRIIGKRYDLVCIHYVTSYSLYMMPFIRFFNKKIIISYWGFDILLKEKTDRLTQRMLKYVDKITLITGSMREKFFSFYGRELASRVFIADFGHEMFDILHRIDGKYDYLQEKYEIPPDKIVVSIGYNNSPCQQHDIVLDSIRKLNKEERDHIHILMRLTYGDANEGYIRSIKNKVEDTQCTVSYFEAFLSMDEVAEITEITDIFIQAQISDARSASMLEHFYAKCLVVNPEWIDYGDMKNDLFYMTYKDVDSLSHIISDNLYQKKDSPHRDKLKSNTSAASEMGSWDKWIPVWRSLYEQ